MWTLKILYWNNIYTFSTNLCTNNSNVMNARDLVLTDKSSEVLEIDLVHGDVHHGDVDIGREFQNTMELWKVVKKRNGGL